MKVSVCVAATRPATVAATLRSLRAQTHADWEVVLVAQGDAGAIAAVAEREVAAGRLHVAPQEGRGLSRARNLATRVATGAVLAMIDDDCEAEADWLETIARCFTDDPRIGIVGGAVEAPPPQRRGPRNCPRCSPADVLYDPARTGRSRPPGFSLIGANLAISRPALDAVGDFDEHLGAGARFPAGEDVDVVLRAQALGVVMRTTPQARVHHTHGWRYGVAAVLRHQRNYERGNGALAAKQTMLGDPRGREALVEMRRLARVDWLRRRRPVALPGGIRRLRDFSAAYRECLRDYTVDAAGLLTSRAAGDLAAADGARRADLLTADGGSARG